MARQKGAIKYHGTIGDIRHFKIKGKKGYFAGLKGGPTANQIKNAPEFARTRENMSEFGGSAKAAKALRTIVGPALSRFADSSLTGRLTSIMKGINLDDQQGARGRRAIAISKNKERLKGLNFNKKLSLNSVFNVPVDITETVMGDPAFRIQSFLADDYVGSPSLATHFKLVGVIGVLSDFEYDPNTKTYEPKNPELNESSEIVYSDYLPVTGEVPLTEISFSIELPHNPAVTTVFCLGIEFYHQFKQDYLHVSGSSCMRIIDVQ